MEVSVVDPLRLSTDLSESWRRLVSTNAGLASPCFTLEFIQAVARRRGNVHVAVIDRGAAFFPFQKERFDFGVARPVGSPISDYHGLIAPPGYRIAVGDLIRKTGLSGWEFNHLPADQRSFAPWCQAQSNSPIIDLSTWGGGSAKLRDQAQNRLRKLEREIGPVTFQFQSSDAGDYASCMKWKFSQLERTNVYNVFSSRDADWIKKTLEDIRLLSGESLSASFSTLHAGDKLIAAHFGMRSRTTLHFWFPSYDTDFRLYSPGTILLLKIADAAASAGVATIDLGRGDSFYKDRVATGNVPLAEGRVIIRPASAWLLDTRKNLGRTLRNTARLKSSAADE